MSDTTHEYPLDSRAPAAARNAVRSLRAIPAGRVDDVVLLVSELVTNAVRHGPGPDGHVTVRMARIPGGIRIEVGNQGRTIFGLADGRRSAGPGGVGLRLVDMLSDRWGVATGTRTVVWFEIDAGR